MPISTDVDNEPNSCVIIHAFDFKLDDKTAAVAVRICPFRERNLRTHISGSVCTNPNWTPNGPFDWCNPSKIFFRKK